MCYACAFVCLPEPLRRGAPASTKTAVLSNGQPTPQSTCLMVDSARTPDSPLPKNLSIHNGARCIRHEPHRKHHGAYVLPQHQRGLLPTGIGIVARPCVSALSTPVPYMSQPRKRSTISRSPAASATSCSACTSARTWPRSAAKCLCSAPIQAPEQRPARFCMAG